MSNNREALLKAAGLVRPALAAQGFIPALTHLRLDEEGMTAYNDISALFVELEHDLDCCVPGDLFIKALTGFAAKDVKVTPDDKAQSVTLTSGKGKIKLPTLTHADFPFQWPSYGNAEGFISLDDDMIKGLQRCLVSVGSNPNHPAQMGITLDQDEGRAILYSTDNFSITRYETTTKIELPADAPVILPTFFAEQILALAKAFPTEDLTLYMLANALMLVVGDAGVDASAKLFSKTFVDLVPIDFPAIVRKHVASIDKLEKGLTPIPAGWEDALERSLLVLSTAVEKRLDISTTDEGLHLEAKSDYGEHEEDLPWNSVDVKTVTVNPQIVLRGSANCSHLFFGKTVLALASKDASHLHLVAHYASK